MCLRAFMYFTCICVLIQFCVCIDQMFTLYLHVSLYVRLSFMCVRMYKDVCTIRAYVFVPLLMFYECMNLCMHVCMYANCVRACSRCACGWQ